MTTLVAVMVMIKMAESGHRKGGGGPVLLEVDVRGTGTSCWQATQGLALFYQILYASFAMLYSLYSTVVWGQETDKYQSSTSIGQRNDDSFHKLPHDLRLRLPNRQNLLMRHSWRGWPLHRQSRHLKIKIKIAIRPRRLK
jgi:hypothetical protein